MVTVGQNIAVIAATVGASLLIMAGMNKIWPREKRRSYNDLIGWQLDILGTTYAVILGFMLYAVWASFGEANLNVDAEATAIMDIYRLAGGLPEPQRTRLQGLARDYVDMVISRDWPQMARGEMPEQSTRIEQEMWETVMSSKAASPTQVNAQEHAVPELESLAQHRSTRIRQSKGGLPKMLWWVLLVGGGLTIVSSCALGAENVKIQSLEVFCFSLLISLCLVAVADIHRPFRGVIHVSDDAFQRARDGMESRSSTNRGENHRIDSQTPQEAKTLLDLKTRSGFPLSLTPRRAAHLRVEYDKTLAIIHI